RLIPSAAFRITVVFPLPGGPVISRTCASFSRLLRIAISSLRSSGWSTIDQRMANWLSSVNRLASCRPALPVVTLQALGAAHDRVQGEQEFRRPNGLANAPLEDHGLVHNSPPHG